MSRIEAERRLTGWTSGSGATTATAAYDGEGNRVALQTIGAGTLGPPQKSWTNRGAGTAPRLLDGILRRACPGRAARPAGRSIR
jgi:hypothetical protein